MRRHEHLQARYHEGGVLLGDAGDPLEFQHSPDLLAEQIAAETNCILRYVKSSVEQDLFADGAAVIGDESLSLQVEQQFDNATLFAFQVRHLAP